MTSTTTSSYDISLTPSSPTKERFQGAKVESTKEWRLRTRGERDSGLAQEYQKIIHTRYKCALCGICIGPGYYETEIYLWLLNEKKVYLAKKNCYVQYTGWLQICGGCACYRSRMLPAWMKVLFPACWETTLLITQDPQAIRAVNRRDAQEMTQIVQAIEAHLRVAPQILKPFVERNEPLSFQQLLSFSRLIPSVQSGKGTEGKTMQTSPQIPRQAKRLGEEKKEHRSFLPLPELVTDPLVALGAFLESVNMIEPRMA